MEPFDFSPFCISGWSIGLDYCDVEWFALESNQDHSVVFEIIPKYCVSDSFFFFSMKTIPFLLRDFLPTKVDIMAQNSVSVHPGQSP